MFIGYMVDGAYYCKADFSNWLIRWLKDSSNTAARFGSGLRWKKFLSKISSQWRHGQRAAVQPVVISNADIRHTVFKMIGEHYFHPVFIRE